LSCPFPAADPLMARLWRQAVFPTSSATTKCTG
jgi:hypothetical protein